jgi:NADPH:quinone reductase-like Zn-dependent oxidoreductase
MQMRAVCRTSSFGVEQRDVPVPGVTPEHVLIEVSACGINAGDRAWIAGAFPQIPVSQHDVCGATASGVVIDIGAGVPREYLGSKVAVYRSLKASRDCVGTWCELARLHYLTCALLPDDIDEIDYAASLVSNVTAFVFLDQIIQAGHKAVVCTAGNSATGLSLLGVCHARSFPIISLVRSEAGKAALSRLGAQNILVTADADFEAQLAALTAKLTATVVFDGVGGTLLGRVAKALPQDSTAYCYGFLAGVEPVAFPSSLLLMKALTLTSFSVLRPLVRDAETLKRILSGLQRVIGMPHFKTPPGKTFDLEQAAEALQWPGPGKAILRP